MHEFIQKWILKNRFSISLLKKIGAFLFHWLVHFLQLN